MALNNPYQFNQAKNVTEPTFYEKLKYRLINRIPFNDKYIKKVEKCDTKEDCKHRDIKVMFEDGSIEFYDAKHQANFYKGSTSYSISFALKNFINGEEVDGEKIDDRYYFALMEYNRSYVGSNWTNPIITFTGRFAILPMNKAKLTKRDGDTIVVDISEKENKDLIKWIE